MPFISNLGKPTNKITDLKRKKEKKKKYHVLKPVHLTHQNGRTEIYRKKGSIKSKQKSINQMKTLIWVMGAAARLASASRTVSLAPERGSTSTLRGCSPMLVAAPSWGRCRWRWGISNHDNNGCNDKSSSNRDSNKINNSDNNKEIKLMTMTLHFI